MLPSLLLGANGSTGAPPGVDLTDNLVAHYLLNNNADDSHGTNDGTPNGGVDFQGDVASFDGTSSRITSTSGSNGDITFSTWVKLDTLATGVNILLGQEGSAIDWKNRGLFLSSSNTIGAMSRDSGGNYFEVTTTVTSQTDLHHIVFVDSGTTSKLYVDGTLIGSVERTSNYIYTSNIEIGARYITPPDLFLDGVISNVRIYSDGKDQAFVDALFAEGYYPKPLPLPTEVGLVAHYPLTGTAEDTTGNYDGTEVGNSYVDDAEFGSVANFDNTDSVSIASLNLTRPTFTICGWIYRIGTYTCFYQDKNVSYRPSAGNILFWVSNNGTGSYRVLPAPVLPLGEWSHLAIRSDGKVFLNGVDTGAVLGGVLNSANNWNYCNIGNFTYDGATVEGTGRNKDVRIYDREILQQEITDIYNYEKNFRPIDIDDGLVAYYPLANNSLDNYYNELDGVDTNITYDGLSAVFNDGFSQLGVLPINMNNMSLSIWVNMTDIDVSENSFFNDMESLGAQTDRVWFAIRETTYYFDNGNSTTGRVSGVTLPEWLNTFVHVVYTKTPTHVNIYMNGVLIQSVAHTIASNYTSMSFGHFTASDAFIGKLKYARIYNKAITAEQVEVIYNKEKGDFI